MRALRRAVARLFGFFSHRRSDEELREEIAWHIDALTDENIRCGMSAHEARRHARLQFGGISEIREQLRSEESIPFLEHFILDLRYTLRTLKNAPAFCLVSFITLALGITTNTFVYGILDASVLRPLPVSSPATLYQLRPGQWMSGRLLTTSYPAYKDLKERNSSFSGLAAYYGYSSAVMTWHGRNRRIYGTAVSSNYFDVLGVGTTTGTMFDEHTNDSTESEPPVILSFRLWRNAFAADPRLVGSSILLDHHAFRVAAIASEDFHGTERFVWSDYWIPISSEKLLEGGWNYLEDRNYASVTVVGRLRDGISLSQATADLGHIAQKMAREHPETDRDMSFRLVHPGLYGDEGTVIRAFLFSIAALTMLVFVAVCFNLATLFSARIADRQRELGVRVALGVSRGRLIAQLLLEVIIIAIASGIFGFLFSIFLLHRVNQWYPSVGHLQVTFTKDIYLAAALLTLGSIVSYGLLPVLRVARRSPAETMYRLIGRRPSAVVLPTAREILMTLQIAMCTVLILASVIAMRGLLRAQNARIGIQPQGAYLVHIDSSRLNRKARSGTGQLQQILSDLKRDRAIASVASVNRTPMTGGIHGVPVFPLGTKDLALSNAVSNPYVFITSPEYLKTAGTQLLSGRDFSPNDDEGHDHVAIVNDVFASRLWPHHSPLDEKFLLGGQTVRVVGVAETGKYHDFTEAPQPVIFVPFTQIASSEVVLVVRTQLSPEALSIKLENVLEGSNRDTLVSVTPWDETLDTEMFPARAGLMVLGILGLLACTVAITGVFGVIAYDVSQRTKELALFVALGAARIRLLLSALGKPLLLVFTGTIGGILASIAMGRIFSNIVYQARASDPLNTMATFVIMILLSTVASAIPAKRALSVAPGFLVRQE